MKIDRNKVLIVFIIASLLFSSGSIFAKPLTQAQISQYTKLAKNGNSHAESELAVDYFNRSYFHGAKDYKKSFYWAKKATAQGDSNAAIILGMIYQEGYGAIEPNYEKALAAYRFAFEKGNMMGANHIGSLYVLGKGVDKNLNMAEKYYSIAAKKGIVTAQSNLGTIYAQAKHYGKAFYWYHMAAENHLSHAMVWIASDYMVGAIVKKDLPTAYMWFKLAAYKNNKPAKRALRILTPKMTKQQISLGEKLFQAKKAKWGWR